MVNAQGLWSFPGRFSHPPGPFLCTTESSCLPFESRVYDFARTHRGRLRRSCRSHDSGSSRNKAVYCGPFKPRLGNRLFHNGAKDACPLYRAMSGSYRRRGPARTKPRFIEMPRERGGRPCAVWRGAAYGHARRSDHRGISVEADPRVARGATRWEHFNLDLLVESN